MQDSIRKQRLQGCLIDLAITCNAEELNVRRIRLEIAIHCWRSRAGCGVDKGLVPDRSSALPCAVNPVVDSALHPGLGANQDRQLRPHVVGSCISWRSFLEVHMGFDLDYK